MPSRKSTTRLEAAGDAPAPTGTRGGGTKSALRFAVLYFLLPVAILVLIAVLEHRR